jgi:hypothetical protein
MGCNNSKKLEQQQMVFKTQLANNTDAISAETLARTTADGLKNTSYFK